MCELSPSLETDSNSGAQNNTAGVRNVLILSDRLPAIALFLPLLLAGYWVLHVVGHPNLWPLLCAVLVGFVWVSCKSVSSTPYHPTFGIGGSTVAIGLLALILVPALANACMLAKAVAFRPLATYFVNADDAFDLLIARGLEHGYPPPDLSYSGEIIQYHYGLPLLVEFIHRSTSVPLHIALYGILPGLFSIITLVCVYRILRLLFPNWTINTLLIGTLLSQAVLFIDVYNVVWHLKDLMHGGSLAVTGAMPIAATYSPPVLIHEYGSAGMGVVLLLVLLANVDRSGPFAIGCMLFAIYLTKQQLFLPLAVAWLAVAIEAWARERNARAFCGLGVATVLVVASKIIVPFEAAFALKVGFNDYFIRFGRGPNPLAPELLGFPVAALLVVSASFLLGTHIYGPALYATYYQNRSKLLGSARMIVVLAGTYVLSAAALLLGTTLVMSPTVQARFDAIYHIIGRQLWLPEITYRADMMNVSLASVLAPCGALFSVLATGAILQWRISTLSRKWRAVLSVFCMLAASFVGYRWTHLAAWHSPASWNVIEQFEVEALRAANDDPGTIFTNDLRFQPGDRLWLPLMNAGAPQLFGQQFYASNFMYGTYAYPDSLDRLHVHEWFWSTPLGERHRRFVAENGIKYLLIRRDMPFPQEILNVPWVNVVLRNRDYFVLRIIQARETRLDRSGADQQ